MTADELLDRLVATYSPAGDPVRAVSTRAYMRDQFPFLGMLTAQRRLLSRGVAAALPHPTEEDLRTVALRCWELPEREYQYFACDWLRQHVAVCGAGFLATVRTLVTTKSWWDTVDPLAARVVGPIVTRHPTTLSTMDDWAMDDNLWLARTAILHQLTYRERTDPDRLFRYCLARCGHRDFFVRKAIGWALREYGKTDPDAVRRFVRANAANLSGLSVREAMKNL
jgi:3-methyladenine DNA glycosylase AlkD